MYIPYIEKYDGIYIIRRTINNKIYVGSSCNLRGRIVEHIRDLTKHRHGNPRLQAAWDEFGTDAFKVEILEYCPQNQAIRQRGLEFEIVSPWGEIFKVQGLRQFAKEYGLDRAQLKRVLDRKPKCKTVKGWHLPDYHPKVKYELSL